jgi:hypothetical protein
VVLATLYACSAPQGTVAPAPAAQASPAEGARADSYRRHGLDRTSSPESRIGETSATVLKMFTDAGMTPTPHPLTAAERRKVSEAFAALPPLHRRILQDRLRRLSFLDGMPNTALTSTVNLDEPYQVFDITIRAGVLGETVSEFLTQKEQTCFDPAGSSLSVAIDAGTRDAILYVLVHEATHIVDASLQLSPSGGSTEASSTPFTRDTWTDRTTLSLQYQAQVLDHTRFRGAGEPLPIDRAEEVYAALRRTPFASLYSTSSWHEDLAEAVALYHLTERLKQPYRIVIRDAGRPIIAYEPMKSDLVRSRLGYLARFYDSADDRHDASSRHGDRE